MKAHLILALIPFLLLGICCRQSNEHVETKSLNETKQEWERRYAERREAMVRDQIIPRGVKDERVLEAMRTIHRHRFVPTSLINQAYEDTPLPIGHGQTISQPYIVALMSELLQLKGDEKVLEIGTGTGYQAAILSKLAKEVYTIEIITLLARRAEKLLREELGITNVWVMNGDGYNGWPEQAPFDAIIVTAAPDHIPQPLIEQLVVGGRMVIPVGDRFQELQLITKTESGIEKESIIPVRFVPMTGKAQEGS
jgi:protein-L-isoaspartate(D-aspartate) O-methyltransferase